MVKDGVMYTRIFGELALFLVDKSTFDVYYASYYDCGKNMVKLTKDNVKEFVGRHDGAEKRGSLTVHKKLSKN